MIPKDEKQELIDAMNERMHELDLNWRSLRKHITGNPDHTKETIKCLQESVDLLDSVTDLIEAMDTDFDI